MRGAARSTARRWGTPLLLAATLAAAAPARSAEADDPSRRGEVYARLMRAELAAARGDYRAAAAEIRQATELLPRTPDVLHQAAVLHEWMGRLSDAEALAGRALEIDPGHRGSLELLANAAATRALRPGATDGEDRARAIELYDRLVAIGAADEEARRRLIQLRLDAGDRAGAVAAARDLVATRPGDPHAVGILAQLLLEDGQKRPALELLLGFLATHPSDSPLLRVAEELTRETGAWELVVDAFAAGAPSAPAAASTQRLLGEALLRLDRYADASRILESLAAQDPEDRAVRYHLARTYRWLGRLGEARLLVRALLEQEPGDARAQLLLAEILDEQADADAALDAFGASLLLFGAESGEDAGVRDAIRRRMALLFAARARLDSAESTLAELERPDGPESLQARASVALAARDWDRVREAAAGLRESGDAGLAALLEAESSLRDGRSPRAAAKVAEAVAALGSAARVRLAAVYLEVGSPAAGEKLLRDAVADAPEDAGARFQLGAFLQRRASFVEADAELREALRIDPGHADALNQLGYSLAERGQQLDEALDLVQRALRADPWNGAYLDSLGWVYFRMGRFLDARSPLEQAARTFPRDPTVLEHLGDLYREVGEVEAAIEAWQRAIEAGADPEEPLRSKIRDVRATPGPGQAAAGGPSEEGSGRSRWP